MDLTLYQKMIGTNNSNITQGYINDTIVHVNDMFSKSPSYREILINGFESDCIINRKKSNTMDLLLRPSTILRNGAYIDLEEKIYIVMDFIENEIYPKANVSLCNRLLKWKNSSGEVKVYNCFAKGATYEEDKTKTVYTSEGELIVYVQYNADTKAIKPQFRFMFDDSVYEVASIDTVSSVYDGEGVLKLGMTFANTSDSDDKENQVADDSGNSGWSGW